ncbi:MAG TPA: sigma-70 family RNA polymerase sigma factor [Chloroflexia bacterium]|nr:sigma-70 family RNA polymerase sigma factor [Chloroflexia bacterium]
MQACIEPVQESFKTSLGENQGLSSRTASEWNPRCFEQVVKQYEPRIYHYIYGLVADPELARDLTQDTFLLAYRNLLKRAKNSEPPSEQDFNMSAWLYAIGRNTVRSEMRRRKIIRFLPLGPLVQSEPGLFQSAADPTASYALTADRENPEEQAVLKEELNWAISQVGQRNLTALLLQVNGFSYEEISHLTGSSLPTVKGQIFRARQSLRRTLTHLN